MVTAYVTLASVDDDALLRALASTDSAVTRVLAWCEMLLRLSDAPERTRFWQAAECYEQGGVSLLCSMQMAAERELMA